MAGLDPAIHDCFAVPLVDARLKAGHDTENDARLSFRQHRDSHHHSRGRMCPSDAVLSRPEIIRGAGKAGCQPHPKALRAKVGRDTQASFTNRSTDIRLSLHDGLFRLCVARRLRGPSCPGRVRDDGRRPSVDRNNAVCTLDVNLIPELYFPPRGWTFDFDAGSK
jgi:hypothetical protein